VSNQNTTRVSDLSSRVRAREIRALSRVLTLVENQVPLGTSLHRELFSSTGTAHVIGVTGSPGAGKSSLVNELALHLYRQGARVAILAVDPSSPYSGGAILGDRIRMEQAIESDAIYVRSMASRGALGGLSKMTADAIDIIDSAGFSHILVETVGVGQGEVDIARTAHTTVVVLVPGMGDEVQVMKAGILEIADIFVINKSDRPGVHALERELRILMTLVNMAADEWKVPVLRTIATKSEGIAELNASLSEHRTWLGTSGAGERHARDFLRERILGHVSQSLMQRFLSNSEREIQDALSECLSRKSDPRSVAEKLLGGTQNFK
jgi:LAO/AO transport system kinase